VTLAGILSQLELLPPPLQTGQSNTFNQYETGDQKESAKTDSDWSENEEDKIESRWRTLESDNCNICRCSLNSLLRNFKGPLKLKEELKKIYINPVSYVLT
jgi:hypothetical protein